MLKQTLNRDTVTRAVKQLLASLEEQDVPDTAEARVVMAALHTAVLPPFQTQTPEDRKVFVPTNEHLSLLQALLEQRAVEGKLAKRPDDATTNLNEPETVYAVRDLEEADPPPLATSILVDPEADGVEDEGAGDFDLTDPLWAEILIEVARTHKDRRDFKLPKKPPQPYPLHNDARVILVGDWGNGGRDAQAVSGAIRTWMQSAGDRQCHVIHLGDVYYAGTKWEAKHRFLDFWPVHKSEADSFRSWTLNGNHDMYAAGEGLMQVTLLDPRFAYQRTTDGEPTTQFHLKGADWQILGMDSSWKFRLTDAIGEKGHLGLEQAEWVDNCASEQRLGTILLSHHQPLKRTASWPEPLTAIEHFLAETRECRRKNGIEAWLWGHEHRCIAYGTPQDVTGLGYAACVGNGAMPNARRHEILSGGDEWELLDTHRDGDGTEWLNCGFAVIDFDPQTLPTVTYVDQNGAVLKASDTLRRLAPNQPPPSRDDSRVKSDDEASLGN